MGVRPSSDLRGMLKLSLFHNNIALWISIIFCIQRVVNTIVVRTHSVTKLFSYSIRLYFCLTFKGQSYE